MLDLPPHQPGCQWHPEGLGVELQLKHDVFLAWWLEKRGGCRGRSKPYDPYGWWFRNPVNSPVDMVDIPLCTKVFMYPRCLARFHHQHYGWKFFHPSQTPKTHLEKTIQDEWLGNTWHVFIILLGVEICGNQWEIIWVYGTYQTSLKIKDTHPPELTCPLTRLLLGSSLLSEVMFNGLSTEKKVRQIVLS